MLIVLPKQAYIGCYSMRLEVWRFAGFPHPNVVFGLTLDDAMSTTKHYTTSLSLDSKAMGAPPPILSFPPPFLHHFSMHPAKPRLNNKLDAYS